MFSGKDIKMNSLSAEKLTLLIKLVSTHTTLSSEIDGIDLTELKHELESYNESPNIKIEGGFVDFPDVNTSFNLIFSSKNPIDAIKVIRRAMGIGLKEAKSIIDTGVSVSGGRFDSRENLRLVTFRNAAPYLYNTFVLYSGLCTYVTASSSHFTYRHLISKG